MWININTDIRLHKWILLVFIFTLSKKLLDILLETKIQSCQTFFLRNILPKLDVDFCLWNSRISLSWVSFGLIFPKKY